ncbi:hypothetical protein [Occallatibacter riparius]|uniref:Secreted protein n=1 Tax=Occallatibacter riparius TaxID=1002689 RepID=A0A9J7BXA4_9BACT|nr:hypothetical protein [Occallatibacter riparius]UWZ86506.1 hypothetical protein MOP44_11300 [Occallatibacter riparius]
MKWIVALIAFASAWAFPAHAQTTQQLSEGCVETVGQNKVNAFLAFDADLRAALTKGDAAAVSMLIEYPLRVNEAPGSGLLIEDPGALVRHFHEVFPERVIKAVMEHDLFCIHGGILYGNGEVQVHVMKSGFGVGTVNVESPETAKASQFAPVFVCRTEKHSVLVERGPRQSVRYRSWNSGHSVLGKPDLEIASGKGEVHGTWPCTYSEWTFKNGKATYTVSGLGCFPDSNQPPENARGQLSVKVEGQKDVVSRWCY